MSDDSEINVKFGATTDGLKSGTKDAEDTVNETTGSFSAAFSEMAASIGESMSEMSAHVKEGAVEANEQLESIAGTIKKVNETFQLIAEIAVFGEIGKKLAETAMFSAEYAEKINLAAQKTGFAGDSLESLSYAASTANVGFDALQGGLEKFNRSAINAREGNVQLQAAFQAVGVSMTDLQSLSPEELMNKVADAFSHTTDNGDKTALAMQLFGRAGAELIPILDKGSDGLKELGDQAQSVGGIMGKDAREQAQQFAEQLKLAKEAGTGLELQLSAQLAPAMETITQSFIESCKEGGTMREVMSGIGNVVDFLTRLFANMGAVVTAVGKTIAAVAATMTELANGNFTSINVIWDQFGKDIDADQAKLDKFFHDLDNPPDMKKPEPGSSATGSLHAPGTGGGKEQSQMAEFEAELALQKLNNDKKQEADQEFHDFSKQQEADYWASILQTQDLSEADRLSVQKKYYSMAVAVDKDKLQTYVATLKAEESAFGTSGAQKIDLAMKARDAIVNAYGEESKEGQAAIKEYQAVYKSVMAEKIKLADTAAKASMNTASNQLTLEEQLYKLDASKMSSSQDEQIAIEQEFANRKFQIKLDELNRELDAAKGNVVAQAQIQAQIANLTEQQNNAVVISAQKSAQLYALNWNQAFSGIQRGIATAMTDIITRSKTASDAAKTMMLDIGKSILQMLTETATAWALDQAKKMAGFGAQSAASTATSADQVTNTTTVATANAVAAEASVLSWAAVAGAAGIASFAAAPWPVDIGAPAFGMAMFAEAAAFSASGGFDIPSGLNPVTQLHSNEMVLPAKYADTIRNMANNNNGGNGGDSGGGGGVTLNITAMDAKSVQDYFKTNSHVLAPALQRLSRNFTPMKG